MFVTAAIEELPDDFDPRRDFQNRLEALHPPRLLGEALYGDCRARPLSWMEGLTAAAVAVGRVQNAAGITYGTGFLARLDTPVFRGTGFITATHVDDAIAGSARVSFDKRNPSVTYRTERIWSSPTDQFDITIYVLGEMPHKSGIRSHESVALTLANKELPLWIPLSGGGRRHPRVFPIGHPGGGPLSISIENNLLDDITSRPGAPGPRFLHYKAPPCPVALAVRSYPRI